MSNFVVNPYSFATGGDPQVTNIFNEANYTWITAGTGASFFTINSADDPTGYGKCDYASGSFSGVGSGRTSITSGNTKEFVFKFTFTTGAGNSNQDSIAPMLTSFVWADSTPDVNNKFIKFQCSNTNVAFFRAQTGTASITTEQDNEFIVTSGTRYFTIEGNGTTWTAKSWSNSDRTVGELVAKQKDGTNTDLPFPADWETTNAMDMFQFGAGASAGTGDMDFTISEVSVSWDGGE